jgi:hypothetical protein
MKHGRVISFQTRKHKNLTIAIESSVAGKSTWRFQWKNHRSKWWIVQLATLEESGGDCFNMF